MGFRAGGIMVPGRLFDGDMGLLEQQSSSDGFLMCGTSRRMSCDAAVA